MRKWKQINPVCDHESLSSDYGHDFLLDAGGGVSMCDLFSFIGANYFSRHTILDTRRSHVTKFVAINTR